MGWDKAQWGVCAKVPCLRIHVQPENHQWPCHQVVEGEETYLGKMEMIWPGLTCGHGRKHGQTIEGWDPLLTYWGLQAEVRPFVLQRWYLEYEIPQMTSTTQPVDELRLCHIQIQCGEITFLVLSWTAAVKAVQNSLIVSLEGKTFAAIFTHNWDVRGKCEMKCGEIYISGIL